MATIAVHGLINAEAENRPSAELAMHQSAATLNGNDPRFMSSDSFSDRSEEVHNTHLLTRLKIGMIGVKSVIEERLAQPSPLAGSLVLRDMFEIISGNAPSRVPRNILLKNPNEIQRTVVEHQIVVGENESSAKPFTELFKDFVDLRTTLVRKEGWLTIPEGASDHDRYDTDPNTKYLMSVDQEGRLVAGTRLTKLGSLENALSDEMWANAHEEKMVLGDSETVEIVDELRLAAKQGRLYDLTRLATAASVLEKPGRSDYIAARDAVLEVISLIRQNTEPGAKILCTVNTELLKSLRKLGLVIDEVKNGQISEDDDYRCHFCVIDREASIRKISEGNRRSKASILGQ